MSTDYTFYGNYCGMGGAGNCVDATDDCCFVHDNCFGASKHLCTLPPLQQYYHLDWSWKCNDAKNNECQRAICKCDEDIAKCFGKNRGTFDYKLIGTDFDKFSPLQPRKEPMFQTARTCPGATRPTTAAPAVDYDLKEFSGEQPPEHPEDHDDEEQPSEQTEESSDNQVPPEQADDSNDERSD